MSYKPFDVPRLINCGKCGGGVSGLTVQLFRYLLHDPSSQPAAGH